MRHAGSGGAARADDPGRHRASRCRAPGSCRIRLSAAPRLDTGRFRGPPQARRRLLRAGQGGRRPAVHAACGRAAARRACRARQPRCGAARPRQARCRAGSIDARTEPGAGFRRDLQPHGYGSAGAQRCRCGQAVLRQGTRAQSPQRGSCEQSRKPGEGGARFPDRRGLLPARPADRSPIRRCLEQPGGALSAAAGTGESGRCR